MAEEGIILPPGGKPMPQNEINIGGGVSKDGGGELHGSIEREKGNHSYGVEGGVTQKKGWSIGGFFRKVWK